MKKGFTLLELIAVIGIISALVIAFSPSLINTFNNQNNKVYSIKEEKLNEAAYDYVNYGNFTFTSPYTYVLDSTLISNNFMTTILSNSGSTCKGIVKVTRFITSSLSGGYNYESCIICDDYTTDLDWCNITTYNSIGN